MHDISVDLEQAFQPAIRALLRQADDLVERLYPGEIRRPIDPESLSAAGTHLLVARIGNDAVGLCALIRRDEHSMELKRLIVDERSRGRGVGKALLLRAETEATRLGAREILLEVGIRNTDAQKLYLRTGYRRCEAFAPYRSLPVSLFMRKPLA